MKTAAKRRDMQIVRVAEKQEPPIERSGALRGARMLGCNNPCWGDFLPGARPELSRERKKTLQMQGCCKRNLYFYW
jgi:hypothetical protein